jgi:energy-coupling factor transporter ATP-binding protein EcfA2
VRKQPITEERFVGTDLLSSLDGLVIPDYYIRKVLPAVNASRTVLLYGPPGNGKTTVSKRIAGLFKHVIYVPYAVEIAGQIMKVYDENVHHPVLSGEERRGLERLGLGADPFDDRWVACRRPFAVAGGELTWEMLDLQYDAVAKFYDAPLHIKALNGIFLIDDFGRQRIDPKELLNRWITPMENQVDYLRLHTGASFTLPFDELLIFSTNIDPQEIMDPALLRRITYKIKLYGPDREDYRNLFLAEAASHGLELPDDVFAFVVEQLTVTSDLGLAYFQPKFVCAQVAETCRSFDLPLHMTKALVLEALSNLYVQMEDGVGPSHGGATTGHA